MGDSMTSLQHVLAELERLDLLLRVQVWRARQRQQDRGDDLAAFYIPEAEPDALLDKAVGMPTWATVPLPAELLESVQARLDRMGEAIAASAAASLRQGVPLRLVLLTHLFELTEFDADVVLACLAPELDRGYERLYAYLHDDVTCRQPTVGLVVDLLCPGLEAGLAARARFTPAAPLLRHRLVELGEEPGVPLLGRTLRLDPRVARFLLEDDEIDDRLRPLARPAPAGEELDALAFPDRFRRRLAALAEHARTGGDRLVLYLQGPYGVGKQAVAAAFGRALGHELLVVDGGRLAGCEPGEFETLARLADREARLRGALLHWEGFDALLAEDRAAHLAVLLSVLEARPGLTFLAGEATWEPVDALHGAAFVRLELPQPGYEQRLELWSAALAGVGAEAADPAPDLPALAGTFRLSGGQIRDAAATARNLALARDPSAPRITRADLLAACRLQSNRKLAELAQKITPRYGWDDLVLPPDRMEQLGEIHDQVRYRAVVYGTWGFDRKLALGKGLNVLFAGPPGTGKTMAADVLAGALGLDLYKIDLSSVVSKYIGETEKNLARIFAEAATSNAILFFDEADALFGKRTQVRDAHDRYANVEISYLLQRMEEYEGVVVLATNLRKNMDDAFVRRLHATVEFPVPGVADRRRIWERIWPAETPRAPDLDLGLLARQVEVAGGNIRNIAVAGAFLAAADGGVVTMAHLLRATQREYQKMGKVLTSGELPGAPA
ncbi:MAG TPA: ATP-binding protein [Actinomycetes bacterium]|nr:ATP-binding protein [Actinomycetes bacterium]